MPGTTDIYDVVCELLFKEALRYLTRQGQLVEYNSAYEDNYSVFSLVLPKVAVSLMWLG